MITSKRSPTSSPTRTGKAGFLGGLAIPELDAEAAPRGEADDVVVGAADRARPAFHAVAEAHNRLPLVFVPLIDARGTEVVAVLAGTPVPAYVLVRDLDVRMAGVLHIAIGEQLVGQLLHPGGKDTDIERTRLNRT